MSRIDVANAITAGCNPRIGGLTIRQVRERRDLTVRQVEAITGINRGTLSRIENGIEVPTPFHMLALSDLYGVPTTEWRLHVEWRIPEAEVA